MSKPIPMKTLLRVLKRLGKPEISVEVHDYPRSQHTFAQPKFACTLPDSAHENNFRLCGDEAGFAMSFVVKVDGLSDWLLRPVSQVVECRLAFSPPEPQIEQTGPT
jgi:hypothetical protein